MKQTGLILAAALLFTGCSGNNKNNQQNNVLNPEYFSGEITGEITVSAYDSFVYKNFLEDAARAFEALYPGTKVTIETFSAMPEIRTGGQEGNQMVMVERRDDPQGRADYISRVNTNLMSGGGADIYAMDVLPLYKLLETGALENLDAYMETDPDFHRNEYRENILDAVRYQNGTWFIPMDYSFNYFTYDTTLFPQEAAGSFGIDKHFTVQDLMNTGKDFFNGSNKLFNMFNYSRGPRNMFRMILDQNMYSYLDLENKTAHFSDGTFAAMLNLVKQYAELGLIPQYAASRQDPGLGRDPSMDDPSDRYFFKQYNAVNLFSLFTRSLGIIMRMAEGGMAAGIDSDDEIAGIEANAGGAVPFTYSQGYGINSRSNNKLTAWAFLKFLLSKEMQLSGNMLHINFPVNNQARKEKAELAFAGFFRNSGGVLNEQQQRALENYIAAAEAMSNAVNTFVVQDTSINDMIAQEVRHFFDGSRTAEETARVLQNKISLYLSE